MGRNILPLNMNRCVFLVKCHFAIVCLLSMPLYRQRNMYGLPYSTVRVLHTSNNNSNNEHFNLAEPVHRRHQNATNTIIYTYDPHSIIVTPNCICKDNLLQRRYCPLMIVMIDDSVSYCFNFYALYFQYNVIYCITWDFPIHNYCDIIYLSI